MKDHITTIIKHYGSQRKLARALCVTDGAVSQWIAQGFFPATQAIKIESQMVGSNVKARDIIKQD